MPTLSNNLKLIRCPHCNIDKPNLFKIHEHETNNFNGSKKRLWYFYNCGNCGGIVVAAAHQPNVEIMEVHPSSPSINNFIPDRPRTYLEQALNSIHAPAGAVMLAASAVDSMLKLKNYKEGSLYVRIEQAVDDHLITSDMAKWAHEVRLDANDQRHAGEDAPLPSEEDAKRVIDFASAIAEFLFVLPQRVTRGLKEASKK